MEKPCLNSSSPPQKKTKKKEKEIHHLYISSKVEMGHIYRNSCPGTKSEASQHSVSPEYYRQENTAVLGLRAVGPCGGKNWVLRIQSHSPSRSWPQAIPSSSKHVSGFREGAVFRASRPQGKPWTSPPLSPSLPSSWSVSQLVLFESASLV